ncbi:MAG: hypothetical protein ACYDCD_06385 [Candidatus Acidiferrales bacterium]
MASIENNVITAILTKIRARREAPSVLEDDSCAHSSASAASVRLREALLSDFGVVTELKRRWGLSADSFENWKRLWRRNPALERMLAERPIGWILEAEGAVVGYLGNISLLYRYGDRTLTAVTGSGFVVEPAYRAVSISLVAAFYRQRSVDLYLTTTAIEAVGKIARAFKSVPLPQADYGTVLFWVLQPYPFAQAVMKKLELRPPFSRMGGVLASLAVGADKILHKRWPRRRSPSFAVTEIGVHEIGDDFQTLWIEKLRERPQLLAERSPATLRWHFDIPGDLGTTRVLCCYKNGELLGYAVIRSNQNQTNGLRQSSIADMLAKQDDPEILQALFAAAYDHAKHIGSHILELLGFPQSVRRVCSQWNPYLRKYPASPFYYKATDPMLHKTLSDGMAWYASPFDGDTTLMPSRSRAQNEDIDNYSAASG